MLQFVRTSALLFGAQMQRVLRTKRALACILLALVPVGVAVLVAVVAHEESEAPPGMSIGWILLVRWCTRPHSPRSGRCSRTP